MASYDYEDGWEARLADRLEKAKTRAYRIGAKLVEAQDALELAELFGTCGAAYGQIELAEHTLDELEAQTAADFIDRLRKIACG